eukprot:8078340-Pyramimonas_sp.AAC.1
MQQANAPDHSESIRCAHQLCRSSIARVMFRTPPLRVKITRNGDPAAVLFGSNVYRIDLRSRRRAGISSNITERNKTPTNA